MALTCTTATLAELDRLPVVIRGKDLPAWVNDSTISINQIYLYRFNGETANPMWSPIPFQIDKRRKTNLFHNLMTKAAFDALAASDPVQANALVDVCSYTYFPPDSTNCASWDVTGVASARRCSAANYMDEWNSLRLKPTDEIVFMFNDVTGAERDVGAHWLVPGQPDLRNRRLEIKVTDSAGVFWVYAYLWDNGAPAGYASTAASPTICLDTPCTPCAGNGTSNPQNICATVRGNGNGGIGPAFEEKLASNWLIRDLIHGGVGGTDLLNKFTMTAVNETDENWSCNYYPRKHGYKPTLQPAECANGVPGTVRTIRSIQGAQSGVDTVRIDKGYHTMIEEELELRVHDLQGETVFWGEDHDVVTVPVDLTGPNATPFSAVWTKTSISPPVQQAFDRMSKNDQNLPWKPLSIVNSANDWNQMIDRTHGGIVSYIFEDPSRGRLPALSTAHNYMDNMNLHGQFARTWTDVSCMQDGGYNHGGCGELGPEDPALLFRRVYHRWFPTNAAAELDVLSPVGSSYEPTALVPYQTAYSEEQYFICTNCGSGGPACVPSLSVQINSDGTTDLSSSPSPSPAGCAPGDVVGYGYTRQSNSSPESVIGFVGPSGSFRDRRPALWIQNTYRAFAISRNGSRSAKSAAVNVTPSDSAAPVAPTIAVTGTSNGAYVDADKCPVPGADDIYAMHVYVSTSSGGPYSQVNLSPIVASGKMHFTVGGLVNGATYYVVAKYQDYAGNLSAYSTQISVTPHP